MPTEPGWRPALDHPFLLVSLSGHPDQGLAMLAEKENTLNGEEAELNLLSSPPGTVGEPWVVMTQV